MSRTREILALLMMLILVVSAAACGGGGGETGGEEAGGDSGGDQSAATQQTAPTGTAKVTGKIVFDGTPPPPRPLSMEGDPKCAAMHEEAPVNEALVLGANQEVANVMVRISGGLPEGTHATPSDPVKIDQQGCKYVPRVVGVMAGQTLRFHNSDGILHNVHALPQVNREFNVPMPATVTETDKVFSQPEDVFEVKCDVHPWMKAYIQVFPHPYFSVTDTDGSYEISGLPAGTYTVEMWHEIFGTQTKEVTVADGETATADFTTQRPQ
ncbi:MAG TPA: carboxypeptidase regulatory-like domain-containing protein [Acidobacteriota bacterium]|nr:carboxypeptidase regulatory-like domain-containing protein [Acidobacteriota bacterium]